MKNIRLKNSLLACIFTTMATLVYTQQQVQFTQYMYNTMMVNPAYTGTGGKLEALFIHRSQWVGLDGAPQTQNFGINSALGKSLGVGLNFINDRIGPANQMFITTSVSGIIKLSKNVNLSVGLSGGVDIINVDWTKGKTQSDNDLTMLNNINNRVRPVVGAGFYLYSNKWYFGLSSPTFIQQDRYGKYQEAEIDNRLHWYGIAGYVFHISDNVKLKPALLAKVVEGAPVTIDVSINTILQDQFTLGVGYRNHDAMSLLFGYTIKKSIFIGYSYDFNVSRLRKYNYGSHDIILKYSLFKKDVGVRSPRFF